MLNRIACGALILGLIYVSLVAVAEQYQYYATYPRVGHGESESTISDPFMPQYLLSTDFPVTYDLRFAPTNHRSIFLTIPPDENQKVQFSPESYKATATVKDQAGRLIDTISSEGKPLTGGPRYSKILGWLYIGHIPPGRYQVTIELTARPSQPAFPIKLQFDTIQR